MFARIGPAGTAWLRLCWAGFIFVAVARPRLATFRRRDLAAALVLGVVSGGITLTFLEAIARIPLATAVAIEFLGPLGVAVLRRASRWGLVWPPLAFTGVLLVTQPWAGLTDAVGIAFALSAGICWGAYILLTQAIGQRFPRGHRPRRLHARRRARHHAAGPRAGARTPHADGPPRLPRPRAAPAVIPYTLELLALRRLDAGSFGTLMSVEPAAAALVGAVMLHQIPGWGQVGASRSSPSPPSAPHGPDGPRSPPPRLRPPRPAESRRCPWRRRGTRDAASASRRRPARLRALWRVERPGSSRLGQDRGHNSLRKLLN